MAPILESSKVCVPRFLNSVDLTGEIGYGMSECAPTVMLQTTLDDENNIGTVGKPVSGTYVSAVLNTLGAFY